MWSASRSASARCGTSLLTSNNSTTSGSPPARRSQSGISKTITPTFEMNIDAPLATARPGDPERRARQLRSLIERSAPPIERDRALPQELLAALFDAGLFKMLLPPSCGGEEGDPVTFVTAVDEIAKARGRTASC